MHTDVPTFRQRIRERVMAHPLLLMAVMMLMTSAFGANNKLVLRELDNIQSMCYTFWIAVVLYILIFRKKLLPTERFTPRELLYFSASLLCYFGYYFFYTYALRRLPAVEASMIVYLYPMMIVVFGILIHHEKLTWLKGISVLLGFFGVWVIVTKGSLLSFRLSEPLGDGAALLTALSWGLFTNLDRLNSKNGYFRNFCNVLFSALLFTVMTAVNSSFVIPTWQTVLRLSWTAMMNLTLGLCLFVVVIRRVPSALVACTSFLAPFISLIYIRLLLGEKFAAAQILGVAIVLLAIFLQSGILPQIKAHKLH